MVPLLPRKAQRRLKPHHPDQSPQFPDLVLKCFVVLGELVRAALPAFAVTVHLLQGDLGIKSSVHLRHRTIIRKPSSLHQARPRLGP